MTPPGSLSSRLRHAGILPTDSEELQLQKTLLIFATGLISFASMFWLFILRRSRFFGQSAKLRLTG